jgi:hypothetical protein
MLRPVISAVTNLHPNVKLTAYMDDILLSGENPTELEDVTRELIGRLRDLGYRINDSKCDLKARFNIEFIGYQLACQKIRNTKDKRKELQSLYYHFKENANWMNLSKLVGLLNFMCIIQPQLKAKASTISKMIPSAVWQDRGKRSEKVTLSAFQFDTIYNLVSMLLDNPCFVLPKNSRKLLVYVDASKEMLGFSQAPRIPGERGSTDKALQSAYQASYTIPKDRQEWSIYSKELWAIQIAVQQVPINTDLLVYSDNQAAIASLKKGTGPDQVSQELIDKIISTIFRRGVGLVVQYVNTKDNYADFPSRHIIKNRVNQNIFSDASHNRMLDWNNTVNFFAVGKQQQTNTSRVLCIYNALQKTNRGLHTVYHEASTILSEPIFFSDPAYRFAVCKALLMRRVSGFANRSQAFTTLSKVLVSNHHLLPFYYISRNQIQDLHEVSKIAEALMKLRKAYPTRFYQRKVIIYMRGSDNQISETHSSSSQSIQVSSLSSNSNSNSSSSSNSSSDKDGGQSDQSFQSARGSSNQSSNHDSENKDNVGGMPGVQLPVVNAPQGAIAVSQEPSSYTSSVLRRILLSSTNSLQSPTKKGGQSSGASESAPSKRSHGCASQQVSPKKTL